MLGAAAHHDIGMPQLLMVTLQELANKHHNRRLNAHPSGGKGVKKLSPREGVPTGDCARNRGCCLITTSLQLYVVFGIFLEFFRIHVWRVPYEACIPLKYGDPIHRLNQQIKKSIPGTKLFAVYRPQPNLRKRWHRALVKTLNDLGNVQPAADSLSVDASLLLNCRAAAENGNCS